MVVGFTTTFAISAFTTKVVHSNPIHGEAYSIQQYMIKFVSDLWQVGGFFPGIDRHDITEILLKVALSNINKQTNQISKNNVVM